MTGPDPRTVPCPTCYAGPGEKCFANNLRAGIDAHPERRRAATSTMEKKS